MPRFPRVVVVLYLLFNLLIVVGPSSGHPERSRGAICVSECPALGLTPLRPLTPTLSPLSQGEGVQSPSAE
jgi:hypothetical protein